MTKEAFKILQDKYLAQQLSGEELTVFLDAVGEPGMEELLSESLYAELKALKADGVSSERSQRVWEAIRGQVGAASVKMTGRSRWRWYAAAAVVLAIVGTGLFYLMQKGDRQGPVQVATVPDAAPGGNKAILILSDGRTIHLDSVDRGVIAQQGSVGVVKTGDGELAYHAMGPAEAGLTNTVMTPKGGQYRLTLPDGTRVWLNAASSITYPLSFAAGRKVKITGEAYFDVATNKHQPFSVDVDGRQEVVVLGTEFNVNAYKDEENIKTTLVDGSIKVKAADEVVLRRAEQAVQGGDRQLQVSRDVDIEQVTAWKNGIFNFNHSNLHTVMLQLARWYDLDIRYEHAGPERIFHGEVTRDLQLSQVLKLLETVDIKFRLEGKTLIVL